MIDDMRGRDTDDKLVQKLFSPPSAKLSPAGCQVVDLPGRVRSVSLVPFKGPECLLTKGRIGSALQGNLTGCSFREVQREAVDLPKRQYLHRYEEKCGHL